MLDRIARRWWVVLLRGCVAILFGILAITNPGMTLWSLVLVWGVFAIAEGIISIAFGIAGGNQGRSWWEMLFGGVVSLLAGVAALLWPGISASVLLLVIAAWAIAHGLLEIMAAVQLRKVIEGEWLLVIAGVSAIAFGLLLLMRPGQGALAVMFLIGAYSVLMGFLSVALSLRLHSFLHKHIQTRAA